MSTVQTFSHGNLVVSYELIPNEIPRVKNVFLNSINMENLINRTIFSTLAGVRKIHPYKELIVIDSSFVKLTDKILNAIANLNNVNPQLAVGCSDFFFQRVCNYYWNLVQNVGSKNLANEFLSSICDFVEKWEKKTGNQIHKGTPYYFLTYGYCEEGDLDSAFACMFKAINEDNQSKDPILGAGTYRNSPAYKYVSLVNDVNNFLIGSIRLLREMLSKYITSFNSQKSTLPRFSIKKFESRFLQNPDVDIEQIKYLFVFCLETIRKYLNQRAPFQKNDFYKIRNSNIFFDLGLITDKILEKAYKSDFRRHVPRRHMVMNDGVALLFEDKNWIPSLTANQKRDPRNALQFSPRLANDPKELIDDLFLNPIRITCNTRPLNYEMRVIQLSRKLRNFGGHNIETQDVFVSEYPKIITWLISAIIVALSSIPSPPTPRTSTITPVTRATTQISPTTTTTTTIQTRARFPCNILNHHLFSLAIR